jgi:hypothetical protein
MPECMNGKVVYLGFKIQGLIRSEGHFGFQKNKIQQGGIFTNFLIHRFFLEFEGKKNSLSRKSKQKM